MSTPLTCRQVPQSNVLFRSLVPPASPRIALPNPPYTSNLPWIDPPNGYRPFDEPQDGRMVLVASGLTVSFALPRISPGNEGVVSHIGVDTSDVDSALISTQVDGTAVPPFSGRRGALGSVQLPFKLGASIRVPANSVFAVAIINTGVADIQASVRMCGWTYLI